MKIETEKFIRFVKEHKKFFIYDTETTGLDKIADVIVEFSVIVMEYVNGKYQKTDTFEQYIRPKFRMSDSVIAVHGITNEFLEDYPYEEEAYKTIKAFWTKHSDAVVCGYNQFNYDDAMMYNLALRQGDIIPEHPELEVDVFSMVKENIFQKNRKLTTMHELLCPSVTDIQFHNSSDDIRATWNVAVALFAREKNKKETVKEVPEVIKYRTWSPGAGKNYLFVTIKTSTGYSEVFYDKYYKVWKSKEIDPETIDTEALEEALKEKSGKTFSELI